MTQIHSLKDLAKAIAQDCYINGNNLCLSRNQEKIESYVGNDWQDWITCFEDQKCQYTRNKVPIYGVDGYGQLFDIFIISWDSRCKTEVHDHPDTGCIFKVLEGDLVEYRYKSDGSDLNPYKRTNLITGQSGYIDNSVGYHKIANETSHMAYSIHIYETDYKPECFTYYN